MNRQNQNADARSPISNKHPAAFASRKAAFVFNRDICPLTLNPLNRRIKKQLNGLQGRDSECRLKSAIPSAEGANLETGETRRISQAKGPCIRIRLWKVSIHRDTDGVKLFSQLVCWSAGLLVIVTKDEQINDKMTKRLISQVPLQRTRNSIVARPLLIRQFPLWSSPACWRCTPKLKQEI